MEERGLDNHQEDRGQDSPKSDNLQIVLAPESLEMYLVKFSTCIPLCREVHLLQYILVEYQINFTRHLDVGTS